MVKADHITTLGVPHVQNFTKSAYQSGNQNWAICKDKRGIMYFGNARGLLTYDGRYWQQYALPEHQIVRAVAVGNDGHIYTGGFSEFGFWAYQNGKLTYTSLNPLLPKKSPLKDEIWKIFTDGKRIIFQSFSSIYIYENHKITVVEQSGTFLFLQKVGKRFFIEVLHKGVHELKGNRLAPLKQTGNIIPKNIISILPYKNGDLLIGTTKDGLYLYNGSGYTPFPSAANSFLKASQLNNGVRFNNKYYAFGTILNGIIVIDEQGKVIQEINKSGGLQNNTVLSLYSDEEQNLWTGLDIGIDRIELNSPFSFYLDRTGEFGTVYSSLIYKNNIYLGTNQGLFYSSWSATDSTIPKSFNFKLIPNSQGQVWNLAIIDDQLICGQNEGTFSVTGNRMKEISAVKGGWTIKKLLSHPDYLIQGTYTGLVLYRKDQQGNWTFLSKIENFNEPSLNVEQDSRGDIWVSHPYKGLYKLTLSADFRKVLKTRYYTAKNGLLRNNNINMGMMENKLVFSTETGFVLYDEVSDSFSPYKQLNSALGSFSTSNKIIHAGPKKFWLLNHGKTALVHFTEPGKLDIDSNQFSPLNGRMVEYYENVNQIGNHLHMISVDDGFVIYNGSDNPENYTKKQLPAVLVSRVDDITDTYRTLTENGNTDTEIVIPFDRNNIRICYTLPYYRQAKIKFQYYLEGYSQRWSDWSPSAQKDFTNLSSGNYRFHVRAKINDAETSKTSVFEFRISPPFYASSYAFVVYTIIILLSLYLGKKRFDKELKAERKRMMIKMKEDRDEFIKREAEATEKQIFKLQTEKLQAELFSKTRELSNSAMTLIYKNELLQNLNQEMTKLRADKGKESNDDELRKMQKLVDEGLNDQRRDWSMFESSFDEAHGSFFKKLKAKYPELVPNDLKLCALLHMNMTSKEMASLLNITLRGVEIRRHRLRKKLNIPAEKNLAEFFLEL
ncbi:triple tyrosine motif-containing protein [Pedobacter sp. AW31-3R]|uniref:helix-turn-helix and ligand-binding sensor domain-containing protein n=1 Tax=Pedobacter sp. AW31-3R TaxID=3445781 RepID=UPI003F9FD5A7